MTYNQRIINERPAHFLPLEAATSFRDYTGMGTAIVIGTPTPTPPLVVGGGNAYLFSNGNYLRLRTNIFNGPVAAPFTLEAWVKNVGTPGIRGVVGHASQSDGLWFDGEAIHFTTQHGTAGNCDAKYYPTSFSGSFHLAGVHTESRNELYVNGVKVASTDMTEDQISSEYQITTSSDSIFIGHLSGTLIIDSVALYAKALTSRDIKLHYIWGKDVPDLTTVVGRRDGIYWTFSDDTVEVSFDFKFDTEQEWASGETTSVLVSDILSPAFDPDTGLSIAGNWQAGFILEAISDVIQGSKIEWDSDGSVTVETSLDDGTTWTNAQNGREVPGLGSDFVTLDKSLIVRVTFDEGQSAETITRMNSLSIKTYADRNPSSSLDGFDAVVEGEFSLADQVYQPIDQEDRAGINLYAASMTIQSDLTRSIEMWVRPNEAPGIEEYIFDARPNNGAYLRFAGSQWSTDTGTVLYVNGTRVSGAVISIPTNRWTHIVAVFATSTTSPVKIGDPNFSMNVGMYATYSTGILPDQVRALYNAYLGIQSIVVTEPSALRITNTGNQNVKIYDYAWSLRASG